MRSVHALPLLPLLALLPLTGCGGSASGTPGPLGPGSPVDPVAPEGLTFGDLDLVTRTSALELDLTSDRAARLTFTLSAGGVLLASQEEDAFDVQHHVYLPGLTPGTPYELRVDGIAADGTLASLTLHPSTAEPGAPVGDEFTSPNLERGTWELVDPHGQGELRLVDSGTGTGSLELRTPVGVAYLPWTQGNEALRVSQPVADADLAVRVRFTNGLSQNGTGNGLQFMGADGQLLRFDFAYNAGQVQLFVGHLSGSSLLHSKLQNLMAGPWPDGAPLHMEVVRTGDLWTQSWSTDGVTWLPGASVTAPLELAHLGLAAISSGSPAPAHTARVDWLRLADQPQASESPSPLVDRRAPWTYRLSLQALDMHGVRVVLGSDEPAAGLLQWGQDDTFSEGSLGLATPDFVHEALVGGLEPGTTYRFRAQLSDSGGRSGWSEAFEVTTPETDLVGVPSVDLWYATPGVPNTWTIAFGQSGNAQRQFNLLGNLTDADEDRVALTVGLSARVNGGAWGWLSVGDDRTIDDWPPRLQNEGDFNLELFVEDLEQGTWDGVRYHNTVELLAQDDDGHTQLTTVEVLYTPGVTWSFPQDLGWEGVLDGTQELTDLVQVVDGKWHVEDHPELGAVLRVDEGHQGYDRILAIGEGHGADSWSDYEVVADATVLGLDPLGYTTGTSSYALGLGARWTGHTVGWGASAPNHNIYPLGGLFVYRWFDSFEKWQLWVDPGQQIVQFPSGYAPVEVGTTYRYRLRVTSTEGGGATYLLRRWVVGTSEPAEWQLQYTTPDDDTQDTGSAYLVAHHVDVAWGRIRITPLD